MNETDKDLLKWLSKLEDKFIALKLEMDSNKTMLKSISKNMKEMMAALNYLFDKIEIEEQYVVEDNMINSIEIEEENGLEQNYREAFNYLLTKKLKDMNLLQTLSDEEIENFKKLEEELKELRHMLTPGVYGKS
tara:strand:- start:157 stop:558 length:402 start_codon:yes stop_codon:yes gene_type:complete